MTYEETAKKLRRYVEIERSEHHGAELEAEAADAIEELLKVAKAMHTWIFLNSVDEQKAYEECGLTDEINFALGYGGKVVVKLEEDEAKKPYDLLYEEGGLGIR